MTKEEVFERIKEAVAEQLSVKESQITMETNFIEDLNADSLDLVELIMALEEGFPGLEISDEDAEKIRTVGDAVEFIFEHQPEDFNN